jgi:DivIVA domain-containing protein
MEITPRELRDTEIREAFRGYQRDEVNDLLERAAQTIEGHAERIRELSGRLGSAAGDAGRSRETEDVLHRTLLLAQRAADEAVSEAQAKARQLLDDAEAQSRRLLDDAEGEARRKGESERRRLEQDILDLAAKREVLLADVEALSRFEAEYRDRLVQRLESDLDAWRSRPSVTPGPRPEVAEVELPVAAEAIARRDTTDQPTASIDVGSLFRAAAEASGAERAVPTPPADETPPTDAAATPEPAEAIDLLGDPEGVDAKVLDDDEFFASLRDAVRDNEPLGPRDEGVGVGFFDQDDAEEAGSFRDVFRRRR